MKKFNCYCQIKIKKNIQIKMIHFNYYYIFQIKKKYFFKHQMNNTYYQFQAANNNNPLNASYQNEYVYFSLLPFNLKKN